MGSQQSYRFVARRGVRNSRGRPSWCEAFKVIGPQLQRFTLFVDVVVRVVRAGDLFLRVVQHAFCDVRRELQSGEAGAERAAQIVRRPGGNAFFLPRRLAARHGSRDEFSVGRRLVVLIAGRKDYLFADFLLAGFFRFLIGLFTIAFYFIALL